MILKSNIAELDRLHMQDQLTGLMNRFALQRYSNDFVLSPDGYSIAMLDIDGLKEINDRYGHLAGNNAIIITAGVIRESAGETDLVIRYGGDEFLILSHNPDPEIWKKCRETINEQLSRIAGQQQLPYRLGVSLGYSVSPKNNPIPMDRSLETADQAMYENNKQRKNAVNAPEKHRRRRVL